MEQKVINKNVDVVTSLLESSNISDKDKIVLATTIVTLAIGEVSALSIISPYSFLEVMSNAIYGNIENSILYHLELWPLNNKTKDKLENLHEDYEGKFKFNLGISNIKFEVEIFASDSQEKDNIKLIIPEQKVLIYADN